MPPANMPRQVWMWSLPVLFLLTLVWYKRKRNTLRTDPGGTKPKKAEEEEEKEKEVVSSVKLTRSESKHEPDSTVQIDEEEVVVVVKEEKIIEEEEVVVVAAAAAAPVAKSVESVVVKEEEVVKSPVVKNLEDISTPTVVAVDNSKVVPICDSSTAVVEEEPVEVVQPQLPQKEDHHLKEQERENREEEQQQEREIEEELVVKESLSVTESEMKGSSETVPEAVASTTPSSSPADQENGNESKVDVLGSKLSTLALDANTDSPRCGTERDSANHSPVDAMLASPSMSSYSDEHSEGSSDSGKGCSDVASPPSRTPVGSESLVGDADQDSGLGSSVDSNSMSVYEFLLPQVFVGKLIGRNGQFVHQIKTKCNANVRIKQHPTAPKSRICMIEGSQPDIDNALAMIRDRFPLRKYPTFTLDPIEQVSLQPSTLYPLVPDFCTLYLVEGINNEVMISSLVSPAHMFLQQPYHPTYQYLQRLSLMMNSLYSTLEAPALPDPIEAGNICVAPAISGWYRAQVVSTDEQSRTSEIKFVDYGGYMTVQNTVLRQIRQDFMTLPFQATECYLANIKPAGETGEWSLDAMRIVEELTRGQMLLAQVYDYIDGIPLIYLYSSVNSQVVLINQELVARGLAELDDAASFSTASAEAASLVVAAAETALSATSDAETNSSVDVEKSTTAPREVVAT